MSEKFCLQSQLQYWQQWDKDVKGDKLFQTCDVAAGNVRSPIVECYNREMTSVAVFSIEVAIENLCQPHG